ncbi:ATP-binding protein [Eubacterium sp. 1001713B170207_170306_E7]|uniref:sensor histidine kinase n=1 Tax=Eubacterium sp. 1001713B170207_170306_E7 TaxID=2787097 RepID=UPI0018993CEE|nr:ATP-binding protein [Eubacterium sp. 1001713B170207_170306_E7]
MKKRITIVFSVLIVLVTAFSGVFSYVIFKNAYYESTEGNLKSNSEYIVEDLMPAYIQTGDVSGLEHYANSTNQRINIIDVAGNVLFESLSGIGSLDNHLSRPEVQGAMEGQAATSVRYSDTIMKNMLYLAAPYYQDGQITHIVRIAVPLDVMEDVSYSIINNLIFVALASILIAIVIFALLLNNETRPLDEVTIFARRIARGDYKTKLTMIRDDKIGDLVDSLNTMAEQLDASFTKINRKNVELSSVLSSMNQGIIAVDRDNKIILINDTARRIFKIDLKKEIKGKNILEVYRDPFVYELQDKLAETEDGRLDYETRIEERIYKVTSSQIVDKGDQSYNGNIIILEDITMIKGLENIRRDFVANVSHELKTPITTIRGFIETIQENHITDEATLNRFYTIIADESERLTRLVNDILILSHLENNQRSGEDKREIIGVNQEMLRIFDILKMTADAKRIELRYQKEGDISVIINPDDFRQMMINLVDNAVKYTDEGGRVDVSVYENGAHFCILVEDTGCGIPEEDIPRIFERFYRVDKSRSKENGGTGLGLAIVKHIVQNNKGTIEVTSSVGIGTTFKVTLPKNCEVR